MLYAQLCSRQSLRDVESAWDSHASTHYHLGAQQVKRSTLGDANAKRPFGIYMELFYWLLGQSRDNSIQHKDAVRLIDSTTIDLCRQQFDWATFRSGKAGVKVHTAYDPEARVPTFFSITTASRHDKKAAENMPFLPGATYVFDRAYNDYAWFHDLTLRGVTFVSRMKSNAGEIASLYKQRWQIELFFKWIKQNLKIKRFIGSSENAVKIQIIIAMIAYLLLHMASKVMPSTLSLQQLARLVSVNLMQRRNMLELLVKPSPPPKRRSSLNLNQLRLIDV